MSSFLIHMWLRFWWILQLLHFQVCLSPSFPLISPQKLPWCFPQGCQSQLYLLLGTSLAPLFRDKSLLDAAKGSPGCAPPRAGTVRASNPAGCCMLLQSLDFWEEPGLSCLQLLQDSSPFILPWCFFWSFFTAGGSTDTCSNLGFRLPSAIWPGSSPDFGAICAIWAWLRAFLSFILITRNSCSPCHWLCSSVLVEQ